MIDLVSTDKGVLLPVHAQPGARREGITDVHDGRLKVAVTQPPEKGKANKALVKVLAAALDLKRSQVTLHSGASSTRKVFLVTGASLPLLQQRIAAAMPAGRG